MSKYIPFIPFTLTAVEPKWDADIIYALCLLISSVWQIKMSHINISLCVSMKPTSGYLLIGSSPVVSATSVISTNPLIDRVYDQHSKNRSQTLGRRSGGAAVAHRGCTAALMWDCAHTFIHPINTPYQSMSCEQGRKWIFLPQFDDWPEWLHLQRGFSYSGLPGTNTQIGNQSR